MTTIFLLVSLFGLLVLGVPVAFALGLSTIATFLVFTDMPMTIIAQRLYHNLDAFPLMAAPFFIYAGQLAQVGGVARRLTDLSQALVGHIRGGLALTTVISCMFFAAASGSSAATVAAIGSILMPAMMRANYPKEIAVGTVATSGSLGILIPPSIPMLIYALITQTSVSKLFIAGILPGLFFGGMLLLVAYVVARAKGLESLPRVDWRGRRQAFRRAGWSLALPVLVIGGIYGYPDMTIGSWEIEGNALFTPTEAAVAAVFYTFIVAKFIYRELSWREWLRVTKESLLVSAMLMFIVTNAILFGFLLTDQQIPATVAEWITEQDMSPWVFLLIVNIVLAIAGQFMDGVPIIMIFVPVLFPAAMALDIDPIHLGIILVVNLELGTITPPVGVNLFVASAISKMSLFEVTKATAPWILVILFVLMVITYVPQISLLLVRPIF
ncbi:MAG: TRAP transporter large permease [Acetobacteraceae bacterium]